MNVKSHKYFYCRFNFTPTKQEKEQILQRFDQNLTVPQNFVRTAPAYEIGTPKKKPQKLKAVQNPQTVQFCETLAIDDPLQLISENTGIPLSLSMEESFSNTTFLEDTLDDDALQSQPSPLKKLGNLSLPQPKMNTKTDSEDSQNNEDGEGEEVKSAEDDDEKDSQTEKDDESESNLVTEIESESGPQSIESVDSEEPVIKENLDDNDDIKELPSDSPMPKKLKRRNQNLYKS